ncbi:hypothetical protein RB596_006017 [Gaeumannomyces avenae]
MWLRNRIFTCVVLSPAGRPLHTFKTATELLQVLRDAVTAHRSLLQTASVLHQDVSMGNVVIADNEASGTSRGILIDLDSAVRLADMPQAPGTIVATRPFMAIDVLKGRLRTHRHDLEAFLYLLLLPSSQTERIAPHQQANFENGANGREKAIAMTTLRLSRFRTCKRMAF